MKRSGAIYKYVYIYLKKIKKSIRIYYCTTTNGHLSENPLFVLPVLIDRGTKRPNKVNRQTITFFRLLVEHQQSDSFTCPLTSLRKETNAMSRNNT